MPATSGHGATIVGVFDDVFSEAGAGGTQQVPFPWPIAVDGRPFSIDLAHYGWEIPDMVRQAIDFSARPGEQSFDTGGVWFRTAGDWSLGAGQAYLDADGASVRRFFSSRGIDPWTRRELRLLPATELVASLTSTNTTLRLVPIGARLYLMDGEAQALYRTTNPQAVSPVLTNITGGPPSAFVDVTTDGNKVYVATVSGIYTHDTAGSTMAPYGGAASAVVAQLIEYANGFLFVGVAGALKTVAAAGGVTLVKDHFNSAFVWSAVCGTPSFVYAGGQGTDLAELYRIGIDPATGGLTVPVLAGTLPRGEQLRAISFYAGSLLLGTSKGLRLAQIAASGDLSIGPLVTTGVDVRCAFAEAEYVWFGWTNYDADHTGVGRANLSEFTVAEKPAYASDLMADATGTVVDVARFGDRTYFAVAGSGWWRQERLGRTVDSGVIRLGNLEWGTFEPKTFLGVELITEPLEGTVTVDLTDDAGDTETLGVHASQGSTGLGRTLGAGLGRLSTFFELTLTLGRSTDVTLDPSTSPVLRLLTARGLPVPRQIQRWTLPIICTDKVRIGAGENQEASQDVARTREFFVALRRDARAVLYQEGQLQHLVMVRRVWIEPGLVTQWSAQRHGLQGTLMVQLDSAEP